MFKVFILKVYSIKFLFFGLFLVFSCDFRRVDFHCKVSHLSSPGTSWNIHPIFRPHDLHPNKCWDFLSHQNINYSFLKLQYHKVKSGLFSGSEFYYHRHMSMFACVVLLEELKLAEIIEVFILYKYMANSARAYC